MNTKIVLTFCYLVMRGEGKWVLAIIHFFFNQIMSLTHTILNNKNYWLIKRVLISFDSLSRNLIEILYQYIIGMTLNFLKQTFAKMRLINKIMEKLKII